MPKDTQDPDVIFEAKDLVISAVREDGSQLDIVKGVNFKVNKGEVVALIGESGSGKTTISLSALGYCKPGLQFTGGEAVLLGEGGFPVGWLPSLEFDDISTRIDAGGRLVVYSDGVTECLNREGLMFTDERLKDIMQETHHLPLDRALATLSKELDAWRDGQNFGDDVSLMAIERI